MPARCSSCNSSVVVPMALAVSSSWPAVSSKAFANSKMAPSTREPASTPARRCARSIIPSTWWEPRSRALPSQAMPNSAKTCLSASLIGHFSRAMSASSASASASASSTRHASRSSATPHFVETVWSPSVYFREVATRWSA